MLVPVPPFHEARVKAQGCFVVAPLQGGAFAFACACIRFTPRTDHKLRAFWYANSGFMQHNLKFGEVAGLATETSAAENLAPVPARIRQISRRELGVSVAAPSPITSHQLALSAEDCLLRPGGLCREGSQITEFLIDTLPIRIKLNSFACIIGARSNRHSSEGLARTS
jgi:hypothetical protein